MPVPTLPGKVRFNEDGFRTITDALGCTDDRQRAAALGVSESTYSRLVSGEIEPGERVIRAFLARFPQVDPRQVFRYDPNATAQR